MKTNPSTGRVNPYPAYKPSGIPWIGDVPEHWDVQRAKAVLRPIDVRSQTGNEELLTVSAERGIIPRDSANVTMFKAESYVGYKLCWPEDLVINSLWAWAYGLGISRHHGIVSSAYGVYRPIPATNINPSYLHSLVRSCPFQWELQVRSKGIWISRLQLTDEAFLGAPIPLPPPPEQAAIVRYLDHADRRIRRYVNAKRKLIALLEEEKQAIINRAVTRGLDPNVRLKPSGVEWLGDVPEHWEIRRLRQCVSISGGMTPSMEVRRFWDGLVPWVTPKDMKQAVICGSSVKITDAAISETSLQLIEPPVVLMVVRGMILARRVPIAYTTVPVTINQDMKAMRAVKGTSARFLAHSLDSAQKAFIPLIDEAGHGTRRLPTERWRELLIAMPPPSEQSAIVDYIDKATTVGEAAIARARRQLELVQEYRTRFIADVVTGKLDVREAAVLLPDETDEESMDEGGPLADNMNDGPYGASQPTEEVLALESEVSA